MKPRNNPKASQGGLTSPKLYDSGLDFRIAVAKNGRGRHVRISCTNVTNTLSSVVIISHPNQLHNCHTSLFAQSQVLHKCLCESVAHLSRCKYVTSSVANMFMRIVADMSLLQICQSSVVFMFSANRCGNVTVAKMSRQEAKMSRCQNVTVADLSHQTPSDGK